MSGTGAVAAAGEVPNVDDDDGIGREGLSSLRATEYLRSSVDVRGGVTPSLVDGLLDLPNVGARNAVFQNRLEGVELTAVSSDGV